MQPNPYSNDPNSIQPTEPNAPTPSYQQGGQYVQPPYIGTKGAFIDWSTLVGMAVYGILYWILRLFLRTTISRPDEPYE